MMMKMKSSLPTLLLLLCSLHGAKCLSEGDDDQGTSSLQQLSDIKEVSVREERDTTEDNKKTCQPDINSVVQELRELRDTVSTLQRQLQTEQVAFGASLGHHGGQGPFNTWITLVYKSVFANAGNAYNPGTGIFTAPVKGVYYISFSGHNHSTKPMGLALFHNAQQTVTVYNHPAGNRYETATNGMTLLLEKGDQVYVRLRPNTWIYDNGNNHSTFVGYLLFAQ